MDPLTALGLASAILQVVDFSSRLISGAKQAYASASGTTSEIEDSEIMITSLSALGRRLDVHVTGAHLSTEDENLLDLKKGCEELSREINGIVQATKVKKPGSRRESFKVALKAIPRKKTIASLEARLNKYRSQLLEYMLSIMRYDSSHWTTFWLLANKAF